MTETPTEEATRVATGSWPDTEPGPGNAALAESRGQAVPKACPAVAEATDCAGWVGEIRRVWAAGGANTLELAKIMHAARRRLERRRWAELWRSGEMPFCKRKGEMLVAISAGLGWLDAQNSAQLPRSWNTLYYLARLPRQELTRLIAEKVVRPELKLCEAKELAARAGGRHRVASKRANVMQQLEKLARFVEKTLPEWSGRQRRWAAEALGELLSQIENCGGASAPAESQPVSVRVACDEAKMSLREIPLSAQGNTQSKNPYEN